MNPATLHTWETIFAVVLTATAGDILIAGGMRKLGDLDLIRAKSGLVGAIKAVLGSPMFLIGIACMAVSFFALLFALSDADLSLIGPATASLTFITTTAAAKFFLKENVDRRRWFAAIFVCVGVALLSR